MSSSPAIEVRQLRKVFSSIKKAPGLVGTVKSLFRPERVEKEAVKGIDFVIEEGEMVGFLGPNGAGKTTTLKMLTGILYPSSGSATVLGFNPWKRDPQMLKQISIVMGNKQQLWWDLPAIDSFKVLKEIYEISDSAYKERLEKLTDTLGLGGLLETQVRKLSLGERMKCELVAALLHSPRVIFLDEPTLGLDVVSQQKIREFLKELHTKENCTVIMTSHYMQDVEALCDRVIIIDHGAIAFEGNLDQLTSAFQETRRIQFVFSEAVSKEALDAYGHVSAHQPDQATFDVPRHEVAAVVGQVMAALPVIDVRIEEVEIEEVLRQLFERPATVA